MSANDVSQVRSGTTSQPNVDQFAFLFTDLVNSTGLKAQLNSWKYVCQVLEPHDELFRGLLKQYSRAYEIKHLGDGFLAVFGDVRDAVSFALRFQAAIETHPWELDHPDQRVQTRIGIDIGFAVIKEVNGIPVDVFGPNVDVASRVMSAADGGRTLLTATAFEVARPALAFIDMQLEAVGGLATPARLVRHGAFRIQGVAETVVLCEACLGNVTPRPPRSNPPKIVNVDDIGWLPESETGEMNTSEIPDRPGWKLVKKLGEGGFGAAYLGTDNADSGSQRVFKFSRTPERLSSLKNELELLRRLRHLKRPDLVAYLGAHLERPPYFLEFEYVASGNLLEWSEQQGGLDQIDFATRLRIFADIAAGVAAAHRERVFHLDLKPSNILMDRRDDGTWQPKITDFGIGAMEIEGHAGQPSPTPLSTPFDTSGRTLRHLYSPPESLEPPGSRTSDRTPTAASLDVRDVYALGVLLFQFAVGDLQRPLAPSAIRLVSQKLLREDIELATHFDPRQRLTSAADLEQRARQWNARERRRFLLKSFAPAVGTLLVGIVIATAFSATIYGLYQETLKAKQEADSAREAALAAQHEVERQYQDKLKAITGFWRDIDGGEELLPGKDLPNEVQQVQLLREIRHWLLEQAEQDLARLRPESDNIDNQISYARLTLRISQLLDDEELEVRRRRLEAGLAALEPAFKTHPEHPGLRLLLSDFENQLGQVDHERGNAEALAHFQKCLKLREDLWASSQQAHPPFPLPTWEYERKVLASRHNLGLMRLALAGNPAQTQKTDRSLTAETERHAAVVLLQEALDGRARLAEAVQPASAAVLRDLASSQFTFGRLFRARAEEELVAGQRQEADEWRQIAKEFYEQALQSFLKSQQLETSSVTRQRIVESLRELVDLTLEVGDVAAATGFREEMVRQVTQVIPSSVRDLHARVYFSDAKFSLKKYRTEARPSDLPIAKADLRLAQSLYQSLVQLDPQNIRLWGDLGVVHSDLGQLLLEGTDLRERTEGLEQLKDALKSWDVVRQEAPSHFDRHFAPAYEAVQMQLEQLGTDAVLQNGVKL